MPVILFDYTTSLVDSTLFSETYAQPVTQPFDFSCDSQTERVPAILHITFSSQELQEVDNLSAWKALLQKKMQVSNSEPRKEAQLSYKKIDKIVRGWFAKQASSTRHGGWEFFSRVGAGGLSLFLGTVSGVMCCLWRRKELTKSPTNPRKKKTTLKRNQGLAPLENKCTGSSSEVISIPLRELNTEPEDIKTIVKGFTRPRVKKDPMQTRDGSRTPSITSQVSSYSQKETGQKKTHPETAMDQLLPQPHSILKPQGDPQDPERIIRTLVRKGIVTVHTKGGHIQFSIKGYGTMTLPKSSEKKDLIHKLYANKIAEWMKEYVNRDVVVPSVNTKN